jgi:uncharacterized metal-binding protein
MNQLMKCALCKVKSDKSACRVEDGIGPVDCPTKNKPEVISKATEKYDNPDVLEFARMASIQEADCYINRDKDPFVKHPVKTRMEEIVEFAYKMNYKRLGLAFCAGLSSEANLFHQYLESKGFEVVSVICKVGCTPKERIGLKNGEKVRIGQFETMCSPIAQAELLNDAKTDFNIVLGLCVGHDSLFFKHASAYSTVFAVKDRVLGHNPLAALYTIDSYYERLVKD